MFAAGKDYPPPPNCTRSPLLPILEAAPSFGQVQFTQYSPDCIFPTVVFEFPESCNSCLSIRGLTTLAHTFIVIMKKHLKRKRTSPSPVLRHTPCTHSHDQPLLETAYSQSNSCRFGTTYWALPATPLLSVRIVTLPWYSPKFLPYHSTLLLTQTPPYSQTKHVDVN